MFTRALFIFSLAFATTAEAIDVTDELIDSSITVRQEYQEGQVFDCAIEFDGMDDDFNYFTGSLNIVTFAQNHLGGLFKLVSKRVALNPNAIEVKKIRKGWLWVDGRSNSAWTVTSGEERKFLSATGDIDEASYFYTGILARKEAAIGYIHPGERLDKIYRLRVLTKAQIRKGVECLAQLFEKTYGKSLEELR